MLLVIQICLGLGHEEALAQIVDRDAFLIVALAHLGEVLVKALVLVEQKRCSLHLQLSRRVVLFLVRENAKGVELLVVTRAVNLQSALGSRAHEGARKLLRLSIAIRDGHLLGTA